MHARLASLAATAITIAVLTLAACQAEPSAEPSRSEPASNAYSICPAGGQLPAAEITDRAIAILRDRLARLDIDAPTFTLEACLEVETPLSADHAAAQAAVLGTGFVELVPVAPGVTDVTVGGATPDGVQAIAGGTDIASAEVKTPADTGLATLVVGLSDAGSTAVASWTRLHIGERLALAVDGVVIALPTVSSPITAGTIEVAFTGDALPIPLRTVAAMIESGPLPPEWAQPERPQG
jgi:preprotein translocase subunit SecD